MTLICPHDSMVVIVHFNNLHESNLLFKAFLFAKIRIIKNKINGLKGKIRTDMCKYESGKIDKHVIVIFF